MAFNQFDSDGIDDKVIKGNTDGTRIGNVGDRLKVDAQITLEENFPVTFPEYEDILYRIRTTQPRKLFQAQWGFNGQPLSWSNLVQGNATIRTPDITGHNFLQFRTTGVAGDRAVYQTRRYFPYQPSRNHNLTFATAFGAPVSGRIVKIGMFDDSQTEGQNGWYVQQDGNGFEFVVASTAGGSQNFIVRNRSQWNKDKLDGTGPSGLNLSDVQLSNAVIWNIDYSWYGASVVQFNIIFGSKRYVCHEEVFSLVYADHPFTKTAFLPLRLEVTDTGSGQQSTTTLGSISLDIENGEAEEFGYQWADGNGTAGKSVSGTGFTYLYGIRPKQTVNGIFNRGVIVPNGVELLSTDDILVEILIGGQATGGTWNSVDSQSITEFNTGITGYTGGRVIKQSYIAAGGGRATGALVSSFPGDLFASIDSLLGNQDAIAVRARKLVGNSTAYCTLSWKEIY